MRFIPLHEYLAGRDYTATTWVNPESVVRLIPNEQPAPQSTTVVCATVRYTVTESVEEILLLLNDSQTVRELRHRAFLRVTKRWGDYWWHEPELVNVMLDAVLDV